MYGRRQVFESGSERRHNARMKSWDLLGRSINRTGAAFADFEGLEISCVATSELLAYSIPMDWNQFLLGNNSFSSSSECAILISSSILRCYPNIIVSARSY